MTSLFEDYSRHQRLAGDVEETISKSRRQVSRFMAFCTANGHTWPEIQPEAVLAFLDALPVKDPTKKSYWRGIRAFWNWAADEGLTAPPPRRFRVRLRPHRPRVAPSLARVGRMLAALPKHDWQARRDRALIHFLRYTGARLGEGLMMEWGWLDLGRCLMTVYAPKTNRERVVPIAPPLLAVLEEWSPESGERHVFPGSDNHRRPILDAPMSRYNFQHWWKRWQQQNGYEPTATLHDLRRAFVTHAVTHWGLDVTEVQRIVGHSCLEVTRSYFSFEADAVGEKLRRGMEAASHLAVTAGRG